MLEDEADAALLDRHVGRVLVAEEDAPGIGHLQPGDDPQERRLAGAGWAEQRHQFAGTDRQADVAAARRSRRTPWRDVDANVHSCLLMRCRVRR